MAETLDRIRYRLGMDALVGFLNGPRALAFQAGKTIVTVVSCHPPGGMPRFGAGDRPRAIYRRMARQDERA